MVVSFYGLHLKTNYSTVAFSFLSYKSNFIETNLRNSNPETPILSLDCVDKKMNLLLLAFC
jgi:hypothetical protein